jgi:SAM-dependent methyltransferase
MDRKAHWEHVWTTKDETAVSWYQPEPARSLALIARYGGEGARVLDVGGGSSRVVDALLASGARQVGVLDVAEAALAVSRRRLGERAGEVEWIVADVMAYEPAHRWDVWHDRAVFHFLREPEEQRAYVRAATRALEPGGHAVIATFGPDGPTRCSGLDVVRHSAETLAEAFGAGFAVVEAQGEAHRTPGGSVQAFVYAVLRKRADAEPAGA